jgi:hypothetical protein
MSGVILRNWPPFLLAFQVRAGIIFPPSRRKFLKKRYSLLSLAYQLPFPNQEYAILPGF